MKKIILWILTLIILAALGLVGYISYLMDWNSHKDKMETELSALIGEKIVFSGTLNVSLFPHPRMSAENIEIINPKNGEKIALIKQLETDMSLGSLLKGTPDIKTLSLKEVEIWIKFDKNNTCNWKQDTKPDLVKMAGDISLQSFNLQDSVIHFYMEKYDYSLDLTNVAVDVQAASLLGPYRLDGSFVGKGDNYGVALTVDSISQLDDTGIRFAVMHSQSGSYIRYDGTYTADGNAFKGDFRGETQHLADFVNVVSKQSILPEKYNVPLMFSTALQTGDEGFKLSSFIAKFEPFFAGSGEADILFAKDDKDGTIDVKYKLHNADLRLFKDILDHEFARLRQEQSEYNPDFAYDVSYDISADNMIFSDAATGNCSNVILQGTWHDNELNVDNLSAVCSGELSVNISGGAVSKDNRLNYVASAAAEGDGIPDMLDALSIKLPRTNDAAYKNARLTTDIEGDVENLHFKNTTLNLEKGTIKAEADISLINPDYHIVLKTDKLPLDNYIVFPKSENKDFADMLKDCIATLSPLQGYNIRLDLNGNDTTVGGVSVAKYDIVIILTADGLLNIEKAEMLNLLNTDVELSGVLQNIYTEMPQIEKAEYKLETQNMKTFADTLHINLPDWTLLKQKNTLSSGIISGNFGKADISTSLSIDDNTLSYTGSIGIEDGYTQFDGNVIVKTTRLENLLKYLGVNSGLARGRRGSLNATAHVFGKDSDFKIEHGSIQQGMNTYVAELGIKHQNEIFSVSGSVNTNELNFGDWIGIQRAKSSQFENKTGESSFIARPEWNSNTFDFSFYRNLELDMNINAEKMLYNDSILNNFTVHLNNSQEVMKLDEIAFSVNDAEIKGDAQIDYSKLARVKTNLNITNINAENFGGNIYGFTLKNGSAEAELESSAVSEKDFINNLSGKIHFASEDFITHGINLHNIADDLASRQYSKGLFHIVQTNLKEGSTLFASSDGTINLKDGKATFQKFKLQNGSMIMDVEGNDNLRDWKMDNTFRVNYGHLPEVPSFYFTLTGMLNAPELDIHVEEIAKKYDEYWKKIEEERLAQEAEERRRLNDRIETAKEKLTALDKSASDLKQKADMRLSVSLLPESAAKYKAMLDNSEDILQSIQQMQEILQQDKINEDDLTGIETNIGNFTIDLENMENNQEIFYHEEVEQKQKTNTAAIEAVYNEGKKIYDNYQHMWQDNLQQLSAINEMHYLLNDTELSSHQEKMDEYDNALKKSYKAFMAKQTDIPTSEQWEERFAALQDVEAEAKKIMSIRDDMNSLYERSKESTESIVRRRLKQYEQKRIAEAKENADNLLFSQTPEPLTEPTATAVPLATDNNKPQETSAQTANKSANEPVATAETKAKVDAHSPKQEQRVITSSGKIVSSFEKNHQAQPEAQPKNNLLRPAEGAVTKPTGTITVK